MEQYWAVLSFDAAYYALQGSSDSAANCEWRECHPSLGVNDSSESFTAALFCVYLDRVEEILDLSLKTVCFQYQDPSPYSSTVLQLYHSMKATFCNVIMIHTWNQRTFFPL